MKRMIVSSNLDKYLGGRLMTDWTADLLVYGAESSPEFDYEQSFTGSLRDCIEKLKEFNNIIKKNRLDAYLSLSANNYDKTFESDNFNEMYTQLDEEGLI